MLVSFAPILVKALIRLDLGPTVIAMWRAVLGGAILLVAAARVRGLRPPPGSGRFLLAAGFAFALDLWVWHRSITYVGAGMATILGNTQVFVTAALSALVFGERLTARFLVAAACALGGIALLVGVASDVELTRDYLVGVAYGLATGLVYGIFLTILRAAGNAGRAPSFLTLPTWFTVGSAAFLVGAAAAEGELVVPGNASAWALLVLLALVAQVVGWSVITTSIPAVPGSLAGLVLLLQPVLATIWGVLLFAERLRPLQVLGALITLGSIYAVARAHRRSRPASPRSPDGLYTGPRSAPD
jgi:drug/metabolite transporter (DMT)-like permease